MPSVNSIVLEFAQLKFYPAYFSDQIKLDQINVLSPSV
jgi:hypothetical protein